jgi:hypothetical protein
MRYETEREGTLTPRVGYTYFGQFVGHDLTHDTTPLAEAGRDPERTPNYRTPYLDLGHLYGGGPRISPDLYTGEAGAEMFKIGSTTPGGYKRDLPFENGALLISDKGDARNLDNLILRQLHVVFLKFHNQVVEELCGDASPVTGIESLDSGTIFERARRFVRWQYQWIVRHDFLVRILETGVWKDRDRFHLRGQSRIPFSIPMEFSLAAFRFGHAMARNAYGLNCRKKRIELPELLQRGQEQAPLPDDFLIEWGRFFDGLPASGPVASSSYLDTSVTPFLHGLTLSTVQLSSPKEQTADPASLPVRTLIRGARARLPSGQEVADALLEQGKIRPRDCLTSAQLTQDASNCSGSVLREIGLEGNTPLFFYLLKESEINAAGLTLGPIGSYLVANVIQGALEADSDSYFSVVGPYWDLPWWRFPSGLHRPINSLIGVIQFSGDEGLLPECEAKWRSLLLDPLVVSKPDILANLKTL